MHILKDIEHKEQNIIDGKLDCFMLRACSKDRQPNNKFLKSEISVETIRLFAFQLLDEYETKLLYKYLNIKE